MKVQRFYHNESGFPQFRKPSSFAMKQAEDYHSSVISADKITQFSLRPPDLLFVDSVSGYHRWFTRRKIDGKGGSWTENTLNSPSILVLVDLTGCSVKIRKACIELFRRHGIKRHLSNFDTSDGQQ